MTTQRIHRPFADHPILNVDAAHPCLRGEGDKGGVEALHIAFAQVKTLLGEDHNAAAFRGFIRQRRELCGIGQRFFIHAVRRQEVRRLAVAEGDGAGFIQQQHVHIARRFHRPPAGGDHIRPQHPAHARHANRRQQAADGGRDQTDE